MSAYLSFGHDASIWVARYCGVYEFHEPKSYLMPLDTLHIISVRLSSTGLIYQACCRPAAVHVQGPGEHVRNSHNITREISPLLMEQVPPLLFLSLFPFLFFFFSKFTSQKLEVQVTPREKRNYNYKTITIGTTALCASHYHPHQTLLHTNPQDPNLYRPKSRFQNSTIVIYHAVHGFLWARDALGYI